MEFSLQSILLKKILKKVMVSQNLRHTYLRLLEVGLTKITVDHETLSIIHHIDFFHS